MDGTQILGFPPAYWETAKTTLTVLAPFVSAYAAWVAAKRQNIISEATREEARRQIEDARDEERHQRGMEEQASRVEAQTHRFQAIFDASETLNQGLRSEVNALRREAKELRTEVISLRKRLDMQNAVCMGCNQLVAITDGRHAPS